MICKLCNEEIPDDEREEHAREVHSDIVDEKLMEYLSDATEDAILELFG